MVKKLYTEANIQDIADAIRSKSGSSSTYTTAQMAAAILAIPTGGGDDTKLVYGNVKVESAGTFNIQHNLGKRPRVWGLIRQDDETNLLTGVSISYRELISVFCFINPAFDEETRPTIQEMKLCSNTANADITISPNNSKTLPFLIQNQTSLSLDTTTQISSVTEGRYYQANFNYFAVNFRDSSNSNYFAKTNTNYLWFVAG